MLVALVLQKLELSEQSFLLFTLAEPKWVWTIDPLLVNIYKERVDRIRLDIRQFVLQWTHISSFSGDAETGS